MKSWLKGGLIGLIILLIIVLIDFSAGCKFGRNIGEGCGILLMLASFPLFSLTKNLFSAGYSWYFGTIMLTGILYFIIGAIIGFIIGKIKEKKK